MREPKREPLALEDLIGYVLLVGVVISALIIAAGVILILPPAHDKQLLLSQLLSEREVVVPSAPKSFDMIVRGALRGQPAAVIDIGVLLLIFTPVLRVALSAVFFAVRRDRLYAIVSTIVLALLMLGFALRKVT
jgi:uncharacterized membrane protein